MHTNDIVSDAREFAILMHGSQMYGVRPYGVHLKAVAGTLERWGCAAMIVAGGWLHDVMEDTMDPLPMILKRTVIRAKFGGPIEEIVWACTADSLSRDEAFEQQMKKLYGFRPGALVKAADRLCNMTEVANDLEFEKDHGALKRLVRIGHHYHAEFDKFIAMIVMTLDNSEIEQALRAAHKRVKLAIDKAAAEIL